MTSMILCLKSGPCITELSLHLTSVSHNDLKKSSLILWLFKIIYLSVHFVTLKRVSFYLFDKRIFFQLLGMQHATPLHYPVKHFLLNTLSLKLGTSNIIRWSHQETSKPDVKQMCIWNCSVGLSDRVLGNINQM